MNNKFFPYKCRVVSNAITPLKLCIIRYPYVSYKESDIPVSGFSGKAAVALYYSSNLVKP